MEPVAHCLHRFDRVQRATADLAKPLSAEDCSVQSMPEASPIKWHLAHTAWFYETFLLERFEMNFQPFHPHFRFLFNSYYNGVGEKYPRPQRELLTRPALEEILQYRDHVNSRVKDLIRTTSLDADLMQIFEIGLNHEEQHQELILTDILHLLSKNPLFPAYCKTESPRTPEPTPLGWQMFDSALVEIGHSGDHFHFDNEKPRHRFFLEPFQLANRLVTNSEFLEFMEDGGYQRPELWLSEGWDWIRNHHITRPIYWHPTEKGWMEFSLQGLKSVDPHASLRHVSYFEAEAYARWRQARLPTEFEWEHAAQEATLDSRDQLRDLFGKAWQWTSSSYAPYPGFQPKIGTIGEYNGKFMSNQYVLRGSSPFTPVGHSRLTYRNFFPATAQWQFTGIRLAQTS